MQVTQLVVILSLAYVFVINAQSIISNGYIRVTATLSQAKINQLLETYEAIDKNNNWQRIITYSGPSFLSSTASALGITWSQPRILSETKMLLSGQGIVYFGQDLNGDDLRRILLPLGTNDPTACADLCTQEPQCKAFTYVNAGYEPDTPQPACFLKFDIPTAKRDDCCVSMIKDSKIMINRTISITESNLVYIEDTFYNRLDNINLRSLEDWYVFEQEPIDFVWSQSIKHQADAIIPHFQYKSPAVIIQSERQFASIIPDVNKLNRDLLKRQPTFLDLENDGSAQARFSYGIGPAHLTFHSIYSRDEKNPIKWMPNTLLEMKYFLIVSAQEQQTTVKDPVTGILTTLPSGFQTVTDFLWSHFGSPLLYNSPDAQTNYKDKNLTLFESWRKDTWERYAQQLYLEFPCKTNGFSPLNSNCASIKTERTTWAIGHGTNNDMWLNSWFQTLRTAYGMFLYGKSKSNTRIMQQAQGVVNLALLAPQTRGAFPTIFWLGSNNSMNWGYDSGWAGLCRLLPSNLVPPNCQNYYHSFDMAWTGYWLLRWYELTPEDTRIIPFAEKLARFFIENQSASGVIPSFYSSENFEPHRTFREVNSETGACALFLGVLYQHTKNKDYLVAAQKALSFIEREIMPSRRWFDFETFFSCSPKPLSFYDHFTRQHPENNLAKIPTIMAFSVLYKITKDQHYLTVGQLILDYTSLTQQVYTHPFLTPNLIGGFTTQNTDAEWSDARQGQASDVYFEYYKLTGRFEYLERGIAALRSSYAIAPFENWSHTGGGEGDGPGALTGIHWCQGSATTSLEMVRPWMMDAYISGIYGHMVGVNGCSLNGLSISDTKVEFNIVTKYIWQYDLVAVVDGLDRGNYDLVVNGNMVGNFTNDQLQQGVAIKPKFFQ